jgi:hypothetical protein
MNKLIHQRNIIRTGRSQRASSIAEFGAASYLLLLVFWILASLGNLGLSLGAAWFLTYQAGVSVADSITFDDALAKLCHQFKDESHTGLFALAHLKPVNGYKNSGVELQIEEQNHNTGDVSRFPANSALDSQIDLDKSTYYYRLDSYFEIGPLLPIRPSIFGHISLLTEPEIVSMSTRQIAEHPNGLVAANFWKRRDAFSGQSAIIVYRR